MTWNCLEIRKWLDNDSPLSVLPEFIAPLITSTTNATSMQPTNLCRVPWWPPARAVKWSRCSPTSSGPGTSADDSTMRVDFTGCQEHWKRNQRELRVKLWEWSELALAQPNLTSVSTIVCTCTTTIFTRKTENEDCKRRHPFWHSTRTVYMYNVYVQCIYHVHLCTYRYVHGTCTGTYKVWHVHVLYIHVHVHTMHMKCSCSPNKMSTFTNQEGSSSVPNFVYLYLLSSDQTAGRHLVLHDVHVLHKRMGFWMLHFVYWKPVRPLPSYVTSHRSE